MTSPPLQKKKKYPQNLHTPKNFHFPEPPPPQNNEIQNFEPPKNDQSLRIYENIRVPPTHTHPGESILTPRSFSESACSICTLLITSFY